MTGKRVYVVGYKFDCLPGHVTVAAQGQGASLRVAATRAVGKVFRDPRLRFRHVGECTLSLVVLADGDLPAPG